jgi:hypothetical protein
MRLLCFDDRNPAESLDLGMVALLARLICHMSGVQGIEMSESNMRAIFQ